MENNNNENKGWEILEKLMTNVNNSKQNNTTMFKGPSFLTLLTLLFIGLKLAGKIAWSWWWVLSPIWIPASIATLLVILFIVTAVLVISKEK